MTSKEAGVRRRRPGSGCRRVIPFPALFALLAIAALHLCLGGCTTDKPPRTTSTPLAYAGPEYLRGTIGSLTRPRGFRPEWVGGYSVVSHLEGTGSRDVPSFMRTWLERKMAAGGLGSARLGTRHLTPRLFLALDSSAVVQVEGLIPPGATVGTRFDVLVKAAPGTQTTSLHGGRLWRTDLAADGLNQRMRFSRTLAQADGWLVINPFADDMAGQDRIDQHREAVVLSGGVVTRERPISLILNQPNWGRSAAIADRINERYPQGLEDTQDTAVARSDALINLAIPKRFAHEPERFMELISHTYLYTAAGFEQVKARELSRALLVDPLNRSAAVGYAWEALGKTALPVIRAHYDHANIAVRVTALKAGINLRDRAAIDPLIELAAHEDPKMRMRAAALLVDYENILKVDRTLRRLLDDDVREVRIATYESMALAGSYLIERMPFVDENGPKFRLDLVRSARPLIYVTQVRVPRVVIFGPDIGFKEPALASVWDNRLMLRESDAGDLVDVFFQPYGQKEGRQYQIRPSVANLIFLLGHHPTMQHPTDGLDMTFSHVINALYKLRRANKLEADVEIQLSPLAAIIADHTRSGGELHPEVGDLEGIEPLDADGAPVEFVTPRPLSERPEAGELDGDLIAVPRPADPDDEADPPLPLPPDELDDRPSTATVEPGDEQAAPDDATVEQPPLPIPIPRPMPVPEDDSSEESQADRSS